MTQQKGYLCILLVSLYIINFVSLSACLKKDDVSYLPVMFVHGIHSSEEHFASVDKWVQEAHTGQKTFLLAVDDNVKSFRPMWRQIEDLLKKIQQTIANQTEVFQNGYHIVGHSQGGLLSRHAISSLSDHKVANFVSLAGVQLGEYGIPEINAPLFANLTEPLITDILYTSALQHSLSFAGYWYDPTNYTRYLAENIYLPIVNNEVKFNQTYKDNFLKIKEGHFFGSPSDEVIKPWCSSLFQQYGQAKSTKKLNIEPMTSQITYVKDLFGLQTLDNQKRLFTTQVDGVKHSDWLKMKDIFVKYVLPLLY